MNKEEFLERYEDVVEKRAESLLEDYSKGKDFKKLIEKVCLKSWRQMIFIDFKIIILITFMNKIMKNPDLYKKFDSEIKDAKTFYNSIKKCEYFAYLIFTELEKIFLN